MSKSVRRDRARPVLLIQLLMLLAAGLMLALGLYAPRLSTKAALQEESPTWQEYLPVSLNGQMPLNRSQREIADVWHSGFASPFRWPRGTDYEFSHFFRDPLVVDLCKAISERDVAKMEELVQQGADVNAIGSHGITPLLLGFMVDDDPRPFCYLLENGADPNVITHAGVNDVEFWKLTQKVVGPGNAVVHLVSRGAYNRLFGKVFTSGGDPNLPSEDGTLNKKPPLFLLSSSAPDEVERLELLLSVGANLDSRDPYGFTYPMAKARLGTEKGCQLALVALESGADYKLAMELGRHRVRLIHVLAGIRSVAAEPLDARPHYAALVAWLEANGESLDRAAREFEQWGVSLPGN